MREAENMRKNTFLGRGMKFPPQVNPATGRFATSEDQQSVKESIYLILMTQKTERFMRPNFGSRAASYVFEETDLTMLNLMANSLETDIMSNEPRVEDVDVVLDYGSKPGCLFINITYRIRGENVAENMVFPFYLGEQAKEEETEYEAVEDNIVE